MDAMLRGVGGVIGEAGTEPEAAARRRSCCCICSSLICNANRLACRADLDADSLYGAFSPCEAEYPVWPGAGEGAAADRGAFDEDDGAERGPIGSICPLAGVKGLAGALGGAEEETLDPLLGVMTSVGESGIAGNVASNVVLFDEPLGSWGVMRSPATDGEIIGGNALPCAFGAASTSVAERDNPSSGMKNNDQICAKHQGEIWQA
jgi:hypothetical protein